MWPVNVNVDPATHTTEDRGVSCEPSGEAAGIDDQRSDSLDETDERTLEEAGYGYGV